MMSDMTNYPTYTKFRVSHFPQVPCKAFEQEFGTLQEACTASDTLSYYDLFLLENHHRVDYSNASVVGAWNAEDQEWEDLDDYDIEELLAAEQM